MAHGYFTVTSYMTSPQPNGVGANVDMYQSRYLSYAYAGKGNVTRSLGRWAPN